MAEPKQTERETLHRAAEAATALLPKLERKRAELDQKIASLRAVIAADKTMSGKGQAKPESPAHVSPDEQKSQETTKPKRGQVTEHIDAILKSGGQYEEPELRQAIAQRFQVAYGRSTVYTALRRGRDAGKYEQEKKKWRTKVA